MASHAFDTVRARAGDVARPGLSPASVLTILLLGATALFVLPSFLRRGGNLPMAETPIAWQSQLPATVDRPTLVYFTASWCPPCQAMKREVWPTRVVASAAGAFVPVMIDVDADGATARQFGIDSIPQIVALDAAGRETGRLSGYHDAGDIAAFLNARTGK